MEAIMPTPSASFFIKEAVAGRLNSRKRALRKLAGVRLSEREARAAWPRILEHKWYMGERLGRDVGLRVAAVDYFENVEPPRPRAPRRAHNDSLPPRLPMMLSFGERP
jgi:hypothetical protein